MAGISRAIAAATDPAGDAVRQVIRAYHGSPYDFDRFDASKIGTGEGAQAYGHGLYFAGDERVAKDYRTRLAGAPVGWTFEMGGGDVWPRLREFPDDVQRGLLELHARLGIWKDPSDPALLRRAREDLAQTLKNFDSGSIPMEPRVYQSYADALRVLGDPDFRVRPASTPGHTYEVEIGHPEDALLDLDMPVQSQPQVIQDALGKHAEAPEWFSLGQEGWTGKNAYTRMAADMAAANSRIVGGYHVTHDAPAASAALMQAGVPGARYWDGGSRAAGAGTRNYVVFPGAEDSIRILRKYGLLAPIPAAAAMSGGDAESQSP